MNLADVFTFLFIILGFVIVYVGYWLMAGALFPKMVERSAAQLGRAPVKTTLLGAVLLVPLMMICLRSISGKLRFIGIGIALFLMLAALFGSAGLALRIGQGMPSPRDAQEPWRRMLRGGIVLALTFVLPFVGWVLVMPLAFLGGFGAFVVVLFQRRRDPQAQVLQSAPIAPSTAVAPRIPSEPPVLSTTP
jgi:hypothetical protein